MSVKHKHIVILGGGFAGVAAGMKLKKQLGHLPIKVTLIDRNPYHLFTPSLYEVATSEEPKNNIAFPFKEMFDDKFTILKNYVEKIDPKTKEIFLMGDGTISYDYLIIAAGSRPAYYNIPGLKEHSIAFKSLPEAVKIKNKIKTTCCKEGVCNRKVQVVIGGGGFSGTELAAEFLTYKDRLARQHGLAQDCLQVTIIQGSDRLLKELDEHVSHIAQTRLSEPNVHFAFGGHIKGVTDTEVLTDDGKSYPYHLLIWTGGVEANHLGIKSKLPVNKRGQITVDNFLQVQGFDNIFSAGDIAGFIDPKTQKPIPNVAQVAEEQGYIAAENVIRSIEKKSLKPYDYRHFGYVVPIRGRFAVAELMDNIHFDGIIGWLLQQIVFLRYLLGIMPFFGAFKRWNKFELDLEQ
ncbi:MAG TPA: NAD(P)/FAD-dependent oxidoreductase [Candidatus Saccharimonadales bacterium]|nr:NAD(P)/FAD-dependent oxidoreductase [Candidatus Saccharimonadales bacterium]